MAINWIRCIAVAGTAFFTTLASLITVEALTGGQIPPNVLIYTSLLVGGIHGGLAFFKELESETKNEERFVNSVRKRNSSKGTCSIFDYLVFM